MLLGGPGRLKLECGLAAKFSATRLPISWGDAPAGHGPKSYFAGATVAPAKKPTSRTEARRGRGLMLPRKSARAAPATNAVVKPLGSGNSGVDNRPAAANLGADAQPAAFV